MIAPGLLLVEAQGTIELMLNDAVIHTAVPVEGDHLFATSSAKRIVAPESREALVSVLSHCVEMFKMLLC